MKLSENEYQNYTAILRAELIPAMGCTEPIAIAYAAAEARRLLGEMPTRITVKNGTPHSRYFSDELGVPNFLINTEQMFAI